MRGAPHSAFSRLILRISSRVSREMLGRPGRPRRTLHVQNRRKACAVPPDNNSLRVNNDECRSPASPHARKARPKESIHGRQSRPLDGALQNSELIAESEDLNLQRRSRAERGQQRC